MVFKSSFTCYKHLSVAAFCMLPLAVCLYTPAARAATLADELDALSLGDASGYALLDLGGQFSFNNASISGNVGLGDSASANFSCGGAITGNLIYDSTTTGTSTFSQITVSGRKNQTSSVYLQKMLTDVKDASNYALGLTATQTFTNTIQSSTTITGNGSLNVIDVGTIQLSGNNSLTLSGTANDYFVINVSNKIQLSTNAPAGILLSGGVLASHVLFNLTATTGAGLTTSGGSIVNGTFLATDGASINADNIDGSTTASNGASGGASLISTNGISFVSGAKITGNYFNPPVTPVHVPEPNSSLGVLLFGLLGGGTMVFRRQRMVND